MKKTLKQVGEYKSPNHPNKHCPPVPVYRAVYGVDKYWSKESRAGKR